MSLPSKPTLKIDWCSYDAANYAVKHWHYSRSLPCSKTARLGVWENSRLIGCIVFAWGANNRLAAEYGLKMTQCAELCRIALTKHETPVSRIVSIAVKTLKRTMPGICLLVSYADPQHGHLGKIYQAMNWIYVGEATATKLVLRGKLIHRRTVSSKYGTSSLEWLRRHVDRGAVVIKPEALHKYLYPLDEEMRRKILPLSKPYPKRAASIGDDAPSDQLGEGGSTPTAALQVVRDSS